MTLVAKYNGKRIDDLLKAAKSAAVKVGVLKGTGEHPYAKQGQTIALIAAWNEFGNKRVPSRPFMRTTLREHMYYKKELLAILTNNLRSLKYQTIPLKQLGVKAASDMQAKITTNDFRANTESTIARKSTTSGRKDKPLIDSGTLRKSIQSQVVE